MRLIEMVEKMTNEEIVKFWIDTYASSIITNYDFPSLTIHFYGLKFSSC